MLTDKISKLKKYLFLISILLFITTLSHLSYLYIYSDAELKPIKGGKISEALIGNFPELNPLKNATGNDKYMLGLLYRSLLSYNIQEQKISSDLASCDISNLLYIECYINDNQKFSNGDPITAQDVYATYKVLQNTPVNPIIHSLLAETTIEQRENIISFSNIKKDINFLNILFQPVLSQITIDNLSEEQLNGNFNTIDQIYSGNFVISNVEQDLSLGVTKFTLDKNIYNDNKEIFIDQYEIKLFPDSQTFLKNKETVNIFNDNNALIGKSFPRFEAYEYTLPQYVGAFINQNTITNKNLRNLILNQIDRDNLLKILGETNFESVKTPYLSEEELNKQPNNKNIESILEKDGYYKKSKIISKYLPEKSADFYSQEAQVDKSEDIVVPDNISFDMFQSDSEFIVEPEYVDKYNFITKGDVLLRGVADSDTTAVYINDYKLQSYNPGDTNFYYRLRESYNTLSLGDNYYKIYFEKNGEKIFQEEIYFYYSVNRSTHEEIKQQLAETLYKQEQEEQRKQEAIEAKEIAQQPIDTQKIKDISTLDDSYYYNEDLERYSLNLFYLSTSNDIQQTAVYIQNKLKELGIDVILKAIPLQDLSSVMNDKDQYDIMIAGINLGYFDYNIFPYFHSSQSKYGYNFSNIRKTSLDIILEDLKKSVNQNETTEKNKEKVLEILEEEQVFKSLYTPKLFLLIDKNIKNGGVSDFLPNLELRSQTLYNTYIREKNILNFENKTISNFIHFLVTKINE